MVGCFLSIDAFAQQMTVKGLVKDTTGEPIIGANVVVKGTTNGTITDFDGNFQLNANKGDIIVISFIGYQSQEVPAAPSLNILLKDECLFMRDNVESILNYSDMNYLTFYCALKTEKFFVVKNIFELKIENILLIENFLKAITFFES